MFIRHVFVLLLSYATGEKKRMTTVQYYLGIDAGGTKTFCLVANEHGEALGFGRAGAGNYEAHGVEAAAEQLNLAVNAALAEAGVSRRDLSGIGMGIAGADLPEDYEMLDREIFGPMFGPIPRDFRNDSMAGLRGGTKEPHGIVIACGTGCVCAGVNPAGRQVRVGGINEDFGDIVSGTSLGMRGLQAVWQARDGTLPPTRLTDYFLRRAGLDDTETFFLAMYRGERKTADLEPMAKLVFDAAREGDQAACDILEWGGRYLGKMVNSAARRLGMTGMPFDVVTAGSVFKGNSPVLVDMLRVEVHRCCPMAHLVMPLHEPVVGALLLGMELDRNITDPIYTNLERSLETLGRRHNQSFKME